MTRIPRAQDANAVGGVPGARAATSNRPRLRLVSSRDECACAEARDGLRIRARVLGMPYLRLPQPLSSACASLLPYSVMATRRVVPVGATREAITVAFDTPWTERQLCRLRLELGHAVFPVLTSRAEIDWALAHWPEADLLSKG